MPVVVAVLLAVAAGVAGAMGPTVDAQLSARLGEPLLVPLLAFVVGLLLVSVVAAARRASRVALCRLRELPWFALVSGPSAAVLVTSAVLTVPLLGVAVFSVALYAGSLLAGLVADVRGWGGVQRTPLTRRRAAAAGFALAAVAVGAGDVASIDVGRLLTAVAIVGVGSLVAVQGASAAAGSKVLADQPAVTVVNYAGGALALLVAVATAVAVGGVGSVTPPSEPWWYTGGLFGLLYVSCFFPAVRRLGVLRATLGVLAGQLVASLVIDAVVRGFRPVSVVAVLFITVAILMVEERAGREA